MGIFDSVYVPCPRCGKEHEFQSKAGDPYLNRFTLDNAPGVVLADIGGGQMACGCGLTFVIATSVEAMVVSLPTPGVDAISVSTRPASGAHQNVDMHSTVAWCPNCANLTYGPLTVDMVIDALAVCRDDHDAEARFVLRILNNLVALPSEDAALPFPQSYGGADEWREWLLELAERSTP